MEPKKNSIGRVLRLGIQLRDKPLGCPSEEVARSKKALLLRVARARLVRRRPVVAYLYQTLVAHGADLPLSKHYLNRLGGYQASAGSGLPAFHCTITFAGSKAPF